MFSRIFYTLSRSAPTLTQSTLSLGSYTALNTRFLSTVKSNAKLTASETLIRKDIQYKKWLYAEILFKDDERKIFSNGLKSDFDSVNPTDSQLRDETIKEFQQANNRGTYAQHIKRMGLSHKNPDYLSYCEKQKSILDQKENQQSLTSCNYKKLVKQFCRLTGENELDFMHDADSLAAKCLILKMLLVPSEALEQKLIDHTLKSIGFKVRQAIFLDGVQAHLENGGQNYAQSIEEADFYWMISNQIKLAKNDTELAIIFSNLKESPFGSRLNSTSRDILNFIVSEELNDNSRIALKDACHKQSFASSISLHYHKNLQEFSTLKPIIVNLAKALLADKPEPLYERLLTAAQFAENELELIKALYNTELKSKFQLKNWALVRMNLLYSKYFNLFSDPMRYIEQCYMILEDAEKNGLVFELDESLIQENIRFMKWRYANIPVWGDDHRGSDPLDGKFDDNNPTDSQLRNETIKELKKALYNGQYQEVTQEMRSLHKTPSYFTYQDEPIGPSGRALDSQPSKATIHKVTKDVGTITAVSIFSTKPKELVLSETSNFYLKK